MALFGGVSQVYNDPVDEGRWGYLSGVNGEVQLSAGIRVLQISALAGMLSPASISINDGAAIVIPAGNSLTLQPQGNLLAPKLLFSNTSTYFVEYVE